MSGVAFSHMAVLAAISVLALTGVIGWHAYHLFTGGRTVTAVNLSASPREQASTPYNSINWQLPLVSDFASTSDPDGISNIEGNVANTLISSYAALVESGLYTPEKGEELAGDIASSLQANVSHKTFLAKDISVTPDTSHEAMVAYRGNLRTALEPLLKNTEYEFKLFASYLESHDPQYTDALKTTAANYKEAALRAARVTTPEDVVEEHVAMLNALSEFEAVILAMAHHADDAFAAAALLKTYNTSEANLLTSFSSLAAYYTSKQP